MLKEKNVSSLPRKTSLKIAGEIKIVSDKQKFQEFFASRPILQKKNVKENSSSRKKKCYAKLKFGSIQKRAGRMHLKVI